MPFNTAYTQRPSARALLCSTALATAMLALSAAPAQAQSVSTSGDVDPTQSPNPTPNWDLGSGTPLVIGATGTGAMEIEDGGVVSAYEATIGLSAGAKGAVTIEGADSALNTDGNLVVGRSGAGTLTIADGGKATTGNQGVIGYSVGSAGTVIVTGPDSTWTLHGVLQVGRDGAGELVIADGASVSYDPTRPLPGRLNLGSAQSSSGTMTVRGAGSAWNGSGGIYVGEAGTGLLTIEDGGLVSDTKGVIGAATGGVGTAIVRGAGSRWDSSLLLLVGARGTGTLTIADGGTVSASEMIIAYQADSVGTLNIGAAVGDPATAAGRLDTASVAFGDGTGTINFNHTETGYQFAPAIAGNGTVNQLAGTTILTAANTYTGGTTIAGGTLQLGDGGATGSIVGDVVNDGRLVFNRSSNLTFDGVISGSGTVHQDGGATTILTGTNTYAGGTTISDGRLQISRDANLGAASGAIRIGGGALETTADITSSRDVELVGDAILAINAGTTFRLDGVVSGAGTLRKFFTGTLILTGDNLYTGGTTISAGTLQVGDGGARGSIVGDIVNDARLVFNRGDAPTFAGDISGTGLIEVAGSGGIVLTGENSYTGGTVINGGGSLALGDGGTSGSIVGDVVSNGELVFNRSDDVTLGGVISGSGDVRQSGTGTTTLTGISTYTGETLVQAGELRLAAGGQITATSKVNIADLAGQTASVVVDGPGAHLNVASPIRLQVGNRGTGKLNVINGGTVEAASMLVGGFTTGHGTINVVGTGSSLITTQPGVSDLGSFGTGVMSVLDGGFVRNAGSIYLGAFDGQGIVTVSGADSRWEIGDLLDLRNGSLSVRDGGVVTAGAIDIVPASTSAAFTNNGQVIVAGAGSTLISDTTFTIAGATSTGALTIAEGGAVAVGGGTLALGAGDAVLNIGGAEGAAATGAGVLNAGSVTMAAATNRINFNHTDAGYLFGAAISGAGTVNQTGSGVTILTADNSYTGGTTISAGRLQISRDANLGAASGLLRIGSGMLETTANITSSRDVELIGDAALATSAGTTFRLDGMVSGAGSLSKRFGGTVILTANNSYAGVTDISSGTLLINGDQSAATGTTRVLSNAVLGGAGIIGGDVTVLDGGTLAPGNSPGTLTIAGDLALSGGSILNFEFGEAGVVGGPLNDLIEVGGDLTLDGTINVTETAGGTFGAGIYRVLNYGGALTDNGLTLGTMPAGSGVTVQTAVAGQVNLVNSAGLSLSFWDGDAGPKFNDVVNGGNGVWHLDGVDNNWTDAVGGVNAAYADGTFAIFAGTGGAVTVDNTGGAVTASGMQLASDGYTITGDALTLVGPQSTIRVGDGTALGAGFTATIDADLIGTTQLVKTDLGTLVLSGANSYTGGTLINEGTLQIASDANLGDAAGAIGIDGATLQATTAFMTDRAIVLGAEGGTMQIDAGLRVNGSISGGGTLTKTGAGDLRLAAANTYSGGTMINEGGITAMATGALGTGPVTISDAALSFRNGASAGDLVIGSTGASINFYDGASAADAQFTVAGGGLSFNGNSTAADAHIVATTGTSVNFYNDASAGAATVISTDSAIRFLGNNTADDATIVNNTDGLVVIENLTSDGIAIGSLSGDGMVSLGSKTLTVGGLGRDDAIGGRIGGGTGSLVKIGAGTLTLSGTNAYGGATTIDGGTLLVNGDQSGATGLTSVASGATLGGIGIIGGDVAVLDGGTLAPGESPGTLTIGGNLALASGTVLDFEFGEAGVVGGALNDLVNVGGDLTLDGTIEVSVPAGGDFGPGIYRVFNYGGALTDNGLALGTMPGGSAVSVQTAIDGQVNLVNTAGLTLSFWDGTAGPKNDGLVEGGDGVWQVGGGSGNWTDAGGAVNADYAQDTFAIFSAAPGTVTVDNSGGDVLSSGMQFASDGYVIAGGPLTLTGAQAIVQVGDGSTAGAGYTATIDAALAGTAQLVKTDAGTLVLTGANTYTGGTVINGGTLRIASDANLGDAAGGVSFDGGALNTTADITSGRSVELVGAGTVLTDANTTFTLGGTISGAGALAKHGSGTLVLAGTGNNGGGIDVGAGTLLVNGDYSSAAGLVGVASGAMLGGTGVIGGNVALADGATLAPGSTGAGTLTIGGDLSLASGSNLAFELGEADVAGGALNDLVIVGGDLALDGTLDVAVTAGGAFDIGVYRLFDYGGTLTDNGLTLGILPPDTNVSVQTAIAGQVNLVNAPVEVLKFWDGAAGPKNDGAIAGGDGTWQGSGGNDNWTDETGTTNAAYADEAFAIFGGTGGTVTVDDSLGAVTARGLQFMADGYTVTGDAITLSSPESVIRVGDGTTAGATMTATIESVLGGDTRLVKTDAGTLVLTGENSYSGGTTIAGGTLVVASDANLGDVAGDVTLDGGTLATNADLSSARDIVMASAGTIATQDGTVFTYQGQFSGSGALTKDGAGQLVVTGDNEAFVSDVRVADGTLTVEGSLGGAVTIAASGHLGGSGRVGGITNSGIVAPGSSIGTLTVAGDYIGDGGVLAIEAELGGDNSPADRLVVEGATSGSTLVTVTNLGGSGGATVEGIKIVDVAGASDGTFALDGDYAFEGEQVVIAGAHGYRLAKNGIADPADGDWYLRSAAPGAGGPDGPAPLYQPGVPVYEAYVGALQALNGLPTLQQRVGNRSWAGARAAAGAGIWGRMHAKRQRPDAAFSTSAADRAVDSWQVQMGTDIALHQRADGAMLIGGLTAHYGTADSAVASRFGNGTIDTKGYGFGATLTWYGPKGFYLDGQAKLSWFESDLESSVLGSLAEGSDGTGQAYSLEAGKRARIGRNLTITPQIQMSYAQVDFDSFVDPVGAAVSSDRGDSLKTRWGFSIDHQTSSDGASGDARRTHLYTIVNLSYEWLEGALTEVSGTSIAQRDRRLWGELGLGGSYSWGDGRFALFAEIAGESAIADFGDSYSVEGNAGLRVRF